MVESVWIIYQPGDWNSQRDLIHGAVVGIYALKGRARDELEKLNEPWEGVFDEFGRRVRPFKYRRIPLNTLRYNSFIPIP